MKKSHKLGYIALGSALTLLATQVCIPALAALTQKDVTIDSGINLYVDGQPFIPTDVNGNPVEVFAYNWTTYLPVRAISTALGKPVEYDSETQTVYVGARPETDTGELTSAYAAYIAQVQNLSAAEDGMRFSLVHLNEDDIPELVADREGFFLSLYTFQNGSLVTLMDQWPYGAAGNVGYDYHPRHAVVHNVNYDMAGLLVYDIYYAMEGSGELTQSYSLCAGHFQDTNGSGSADPGDEYSVTPTTWFKDGETITQEEYDTAYISRGYERLCGIKTAQEMLADLSAGPVDVMPILEFSRQSVTDHMPDREYTVSFDPSDLSQTSEGWMLSAEFFSTDYYDSTDVLDLQAGKTIQICRQTVTIDTVEQVKDLRNRVAFVILNGGIEAGGYELTLEEDGLYRTTNMDSYPLYYSIGKGTFPISPAVEITDFSGGDPADPPVVTGIAELPDSIVEKWTEENTTILLIDGEIISIVRDWTP